MAPLLELLPVELLELLEAPPAEGLAMLVPAPLLLVPELDVVPDEGLAMLVPAELLVLALLVVLVVVVGAVSATVVGGVAVVAAVAAPELESASTPPQPASARATLLANDIPTNRLTTCRIEPPK